MIHKKKITTSLLGAITLSGSSFAGEIAVPPAPEPTHSGDWCESLSDFGKFYSNPDAKFIQELKFFGRLHYTYANISGDDVNDDSFSEDFDEFRRFRIGAQIKFLDHFKIMGRANLVSDGARNGLGRDFAFQDWDELKLTFSKKNILGLDNFSASYGRHKIGVGAEARRSSKKIKTVERAAISNKIFTNRYTGLTLSAEKGNWEGTFGYLSLDETDGVGNFDHGNAIYLLSEHKLANGDLSFDLFYNLDADDSGDDEVGVGYEWAATASYSTKIGAWNLNTQFVFGDNGDEDYQGSEARTGNFWGVIIEPSVYLIEDKLEFVARYAYQGSEEDEGIRTNSRYFRGGDALDGADINSGRGDSHHSIYAGLNYYFCGHSSKVLLGVEYDTLETPDGDADATTLWAAYRIYF